MLSIEQELTNEQNGLTYKIGEKIGSGGFGSVYLSHIEGSNQK